MAQQPHASFHPKLCSNDGAGRIGGKKLVNKCDREKMSKEPAERHSCNFRR